MKKFDKIDKFMKYNEINTLSIIHDDDECSFSYHGCDVCKSGGNNVYECHGYSEKHDKIFDGFDVCHECICLIYNGE